MNYRSFLVFYLVAIFAARAGSPESVTITPAAGQRGTEVEVWIAGKHLADARGLLFDEPGIEVIGVSDAVDEKFKAKLKIAPDARLGEYVFRAITKSGIGDARLFYVTPYPLLKEVGEAKDNPHKPQAVPLGVSIVGATPDEDQDVFEVEMKKGQRLAAEVVGIRLSTKQQYDPHLKITGLNEQTVLAEMDDGPFTRQDPALSIIAPSDGKYRVIVREATNIGLRRSEYVLHLGSHPRPVVAYPAGGKAGDELRVRFLGDAGGAFEQAVRLPDAVDTRIGVFAEQDGVVAPQANFLRVVAFGNVLEAEPNDVATKATQASGALPLAFNGIIQTAGDVDFFKFTAKKNETFDFRVFARELSSPLDAMIAITKADGTPLVNNDDSDGLDSYQRWKVPADGEYCLNVRDRLQRGGPLFIYRLEAHPVQARLASYLPEMVLNSSQRHRAVAVPRGNRTVTLVRVKRSDAPGDVILVPDGLPGGVSIASTIMDKSVDTVPMVFAAAGDAALVQKTFRLFPKLSDGAANANVLSRVEHRVEITENGNLRPYYGINESTLPLAVTEEVPVSVELLQPRAPILRDGQKTLRVTANRKLNAEGKPIYNGAIAIKLFYAPPGIGTPGLVKIEPGKNEGITTISAAKDAPLMKWKTCVAASIDAGNGEMWISTELVELEVAEPFVSATIKRAYIEQGGESTISVALDQKIPFEGKARLRLDGLPRGVSAEECEFTKDDQVVKFTIKAAPDARVGQHKTLVVAFTLERDGEPMTATVGRGGVLRVDKNVPSNTALK